MLDRQRPASSLLHHLESTSDGIVGHFEDYVFGSHFQPIYSLSHMRLVGHEALLRARDRQGRPVPPPQVFEACTDGKKLGQCDRTSRLVHMGNYVRQGRGGEWLFLNIHPNVFHQLAVIDGPRYLREISAHFGLPTESLVLEVLEAEHDDHALFTDAMHIARDAGMLIAIDDFGAGHSNFDRVWRMRPDIVKLDRNLVAHAARERRVQRVVSQMVSLLHECGAMVLMEGIETHDEALLALDCDADMVQGYHFGRPQAALAPARHAPEPLRKLYEGLLQQRRVKRVEHRERVGPLLNAIGHAGVLLSAGRSMEEACGAVLELPDAEVCYVLDADGYQLGSNMWAPGHEPEQRRTFEPMRETEGACWSRRPYFRRALDNPGRAQITRPYRTMHGQHQCVTASMAYRCLVDGQTEVRVVCGDVRWVESA
ncbi:MAG: EAL domain-containing protein [Aquabacterium sp.]|jgi:EAL domain-containing protein (putative c-di-GMP-specific phosphodiesterase class I)|nr:MAG: EAL domain-containing protein [Aquabacterium sp.]